MVQYGFLTMLFFISSLADDVGIFPKNYCVIWEVPYVYWCYYDIDLDLKMNVHMT